MAMNCHFCGTELQIKIDLGRQPLANALLGSPDQEELFYDAKWGWCPECQLLQLANPMKLEQMFTGDYPFITDSSKVMVEHFRETADMLYKRYDLRDRAVVEIGVNAGGMIEHLSECFRIGYETSEACFPYLQEKDVPYIGKYFNEDTANLLLSKRGGAGVDLIYSANTLRSVPQLGSIFKGAYNILKDDGVFIIEEPYLVSILEGGEIDQFYDENVYCFTATAMDHLARRYGFYLDDVEHLPTHGGSMRYHLTKKYRKWNENNLDDISAERTISDMLDRFMWMVEDISSSFGGQLIKLFINNVRVVGYGATAKSSVMLNFIKSGTAQIDCIYDTTPIKWGKYTPGTHIPIRDAKDFASDDADIVVLFAWNHAKEIIERENKIKPRKWLVYAPNGVHYL